MTNYKEKLEEAKKDIHDIIVQTCISEVEDACDEYLNQEVSAAELITNPDVFPKLNFFFSVANRPALVNSAVKDHLTAEGFVYRDGLSGTGYYLE